MAEIVKMHEARRRRRPVAWEPEQREPNHRGRDRLHAEMRKPERLWREALGERFREHRSRRGEKLTDTAKTAGVSPQYLSEVERGRKEPSSEMIAAIAGALGTTLVELTGEVATELQRQGAPRSGGNALLLAA
ncbi:helix-turn-helix domain-containing protein [Paramicrobacterium agarici]|uniref:DNA-binding XRE family transcriptional regulator n=1 Tax=Paramicrobacterium agarici TaxID=630514 RepID=A0A2A9DUJ4_9MICO|nr:DNA-binding XRE family transcriptional regulator [Microbacterium agarici]